MKTGDRQMIKANVFRNVIDGRTKATLKQLGCFKDKEKDRDLSSYGPVNTDPRFCAINYCKPNVSIYK